MHRVLKVVPIKCTTIFVHFIIKIVITSQYNVLHERNPCAFTLSLTLRDADSDVTLRATNKRGRTICVADSLELHELSHRNHRCMLWATSLRRWKIAFLKWMSRQYFPPAYSNTALNSPRVPLPVTSLVSVRIPLCDPFGALPEPLLAHQMLKKESQEELSKYSESDAESRELTRQIQNQATPPALPQSAPLNRNRRLIPTAVC